MATIQITNTQTTPIDKDNLEVVYTFTTSAGDVYVDGSRIVPKTTDLAVFGTTCGANILSALTQKEISDWLSVYVAGRTLKYATGADLISTLREAYRSYSQWELCKLANVLMAYYNAGAVTATQLQNAFGLTSTQWTTLATQIQNYSTIYTQAVAAQGK